MTNKTYFTVLTALILAYILLVLFCFPYARFAIWAAVPVVIYVICKDIFTGNSWLPTYKPAKPINTFKQEVKIAMPISGNEKQGYLQLVHQLVNPALWPILEPFVNGLQTFDSTNEQNTPLYSLAQFADENDIPFIMGMDLKAAIEDLEWRIQSALKVNYSTMIELPSSNSWQAHASVSYDGVFKTFNDALLKHGFQLGFIDTGSAEYMLMVFKTEHKPQVQDAVNLTGYKYYEI